MALSCDSVFFEVLGGTSWGWSVLSKAGSCYGFVLSEVDSDRSSASSALPRVSGAPLQQVGPRVDWLPMPPPQTEESHHLILVVL